ncbi:YtxH domain-containing protein [Streptacidiphilus sp. P02-A3a]|uniref:YtxH domain-containing protein n=1 Tax=Streptacidiphilus sp. P02-A3a TaxID=2704468 RepID=UPI0015F95E36|nr:YtxH domain-containing protein [Streptacidiphilus sp. P02-A3a]QMU69635.1 YtxH domain-containing protein [Streptacidiphilus sp. P02-A3a]
MHKPTFIAGLAVGYVLGTKAGNERYEQIRKASQAIVQAPAVQAATRTATHAAGSATHTAAHTLVERIGHRLHPATHERLSQLRARTAVYRAGDPETTTAHP